MDILKEKTCFIFDFDGTLADSMGFWEIYKRSKPNLGAFYGYMKGVYNRYIKPMPGSVEFVRFCHDAGKKCYIATATDLSVCGECIKRLGFDKYVEKSFSCKDYGVSKTEGFYHIVAAETGFAPKDILIFEDNTAWAMAAYDAGFDIAAVYEKHNADFDKLAFFATLVIHDFSDFKKSLKSVDNIKKVCYNA